MSTNHDLDLLIINPGGRLNIYQSLANKLAAIEPPVWSGLIATFIRNKGFTVDILDANALDLAPEEVAAHVKERNPLLTAVVIYGHQPSASTQVMPSAGAICTAIKNESNDANVILVGGHVTALPEQTLQEESADFVCTGEGPYTLLDLVQALKETSPNLKAVRGICFDEEGAVTTTQAAPLVSNLDGEMPGMAWDLLPMDKYRAHNWECFGGLERQPYASLYTSLGCPYKCSFCCIQSPFKEGEREAGYSPNVNTYRLWSPEATMAQIDTLVNDYGVRNFKIADEMFVLNRKHVEGICDAIIERGYDLNIWAYARVDTVKEGMPEKLKKAGFNWLAFGIEAASESVRDNVQKGYSQEDIYSTVQKVQSEGIYVIGNYIFGLPEDTHDTMQETLDLAMDLNCEFANMYCTMAYPGSELYKEALQHGWELPETWGGYSQHSIDTRPLPTNHLNASEVLRFRDDAFHTYFANPSFLKMIEQKFGQVTVNHINDMASHRLERQFT
jgi:radical SAM superfamily enzyme YgiQ (UPF0313 family)